MSNKIQEEVLKQFDAEFVAVVDYPPLIANIVPVPKNDDKNMHVCELSESKQNMSQRRFHVTSYRCFNG